MENKAKSIILENISETPCFVIEFPCPKCGKDIRVLDGHLNNVFQLARCRNCGMGGMIMPFQNQGQNEWNLSFYEFINHDIKYHAKLTEQLAYLPTGIAIVELMEDPEEISDESFINNLTSEMTLFFFASMVTLTEDGIRVIAQKGIYPRGETISSTLLSYRNCCYKTISSFTFKVGRVLQGYAYLLPWAHTENDKFITKLGNPGDKIDNIMYNIIFNNWNPDGFLVPEITFGGLIEIMDKTNKVSDIPVSGQIPLSFYESLNLLKKHEINKEKVKNLPIFTINDAEQHETYNESINEMEKILSNHIADGNRNLN